MFVEDLFCGWIKARQAAGADAEKTVESLLSWMDQDDYGFCCQLEREGVNQAFVLEDEVLSHRALGLFRSSNVDYSDCVILSNCRARNLDLYTFDKRLSKLAGASPVSV